MAGPVIHRSAVDWRLVNAMEEHVRDIPRMADVLCQIGLAGDPLAPGTCYFLGAVLRRMGDELNQQFDAAADDRNAAHEEGVRCA